jgi:hypothetical protein
VGDGVYASKRLATRAMMNIRYVGVNSTLTTLLEGIQMLVGLKMVLISSKTRLATL